MCCCDVVIGILVLFIIHNFYYHENSVTGLYLEQFVIEAVDSINEKIIASVL